jgi:hypothetical protein
MARWSTIVGTGLAAALLLAGCSDTEPGTPNPATSGPAESSQSTSPTDDVPAHGAPKVDNPLDLSHFTTQEPCDVISEAEMTEFFGSGVTGEPDIGAATTKCAWHVPRGQAGVIVTLTRGSAFSLSALYSNRDDMAVFDELAPASGYPAVSYNLGDERPQGRCTIRVGTSDTQTVDVSLALSEDKIGQIDPCEATHEVASTVIDNIKERN